jgi:SpoVK/Ycf46/Vps4 family AAA+-type ATPase
VLEQERKDLIAAIVSHSQVVFRDIISGKGGGSIFLLHGPPGVGKTLTAEAAAEMLHKPLYPVSMAELGTTPAELEAGLTKILELASEWGAIVLMDEADIFLERRSQNEIVRNAMVGVLLRQLEYYPGVLFLTSNRVDVFDEALHSRITVALRYEELSETIRAQVWTSLLSAAGLALADHVNELASFVLNGRQIKNAIALAQGLARSSGSDVTIQHLLRTINVILQFKSDLMKK